MVVTQAPLEIEGMGYSASGVGTASYGTPLNKHEATAPYYALREIPHGSIS